MKKMIAALAACVSISAGANDGNATHELMVISKMAGACGVMQQMAAFQSSTQLDGGNEFVARFLRTEFTRLGKDEDAFLNECQQAIAVYNQYWKIAEEAEAEQ